MKNKLIGAAATAIAMVSASSAFAQISNYEQFEAEAKNFQTPSYTAGTASFNTEISYNKGDSVPLLETDAKEYVVKALNDICQKNLHSPIDSS